MLYVMGHSIVQSEVQCLLELDKLNGDLMVIYMVWFHLYTDIPIFLGV